MTMPKTYEDLLQKAKERPVTDERVVAPQRSDVATDDRKARRIEKQKHEATLAQFERFLTGASNKVTRK